MKSLQVKLEKDILFITLNRPEKKNALNPELINELLLIFKKKWSAKAIVLTGSGKAFCSGADLKSLSDESSFTKKDLENLFTLLEVIEKHPLPVITKVHGFAIGGGIGLLSASDVVITEENTKFRFSETKLGLVPSVISPFVLKKIGLSQSRFLMLSAIVFSEKESMRIGLSHFTGTKKECDLFLLNLLKNFKETDLKAISKTKLWLNSIKLMAPSNIKKESVDIIHQARKNPMTKEKIKHLLNKKK